MQSTVTYLYDLDDETPHRAIRIVAQTLKVKGVGDHARMAQEAMNQWRHDNGLDPEPNAAADGGQPAAKEPTQEQMVLYHAYLRWAKCAASTRKVLVVRGEQTLDPDQTDGWPWEESSLAALGLDRPQGSLDLPVDLLEAWERATDMVNPGVFGRNNLNSAAKKKTGVLSVT